VSRQTVLPCAYWTSTATAMLHPRLRTFHRRVAPVGAPTARVQRGPSQAARCASTGAWAGRSILSCHFSPFRPQGEWPRLPFTARIGRAQFHRARSASTKGTWPLPSPFFSLDRGTPHLTMIPGLDSTLKW